MLTPCPECGSQWPRHEPNCSHYVLTEAEQQFTPGHTGMDLAPIAIDRVHMAFHPNDRPGHDPSVMPPGVDPIKPTRDMLSTHAADIVSDMLTSQVLASPHFTDPLDRVYSSGTDVRITYPIGQYNTACALIGLPPDTIKQVIEQMHEHWLVERLVNGKWEEFANSKPPTSAAVLPAQPAQPDSTRDLLLRVYSQGSDVRITYPIGEYNAACALIAMPLETIKLCIERMHGSWFVERLVDAKRWEELAKSKPPTQEVQTFIEHRDMRPDVQHDHSAVWAMRTLSKRLQDDPGYAWSWHCNVAMASVDEGMSRPAADRAAARFMRNAFGIDTSKNEHYAETQVTREEAGK